MLATVVFFNESFTNIVTITFSALIVIELLNVYSEVSLSYKDNMMMYRSTNQTGK